MSPGSDFSDMPRPDAEPLVCQVMRERGTATIRATGSLDLATVPVLEAHVAELRAAGVRHIVLDLSGLDFMDSTGLRCILEFNAKARQDGFAIALIQGPRAVRRVFELTGTAAQLPFIDR